MFLTTYLYPFYLLFPSLLISFLHAKDFLQAKIHDDRRLHGGRIRRGAFFVRMGSQLPTAANRNENGRVKVSTISFQILILQRNKKLFLLCSYE
jgi:hypothetical protein